MSLPVSRETIHAARMADLHQFLIDNHPEEIIREGSYIRLKEHSSICIKQHHSGYCRFSDATEHGNGIDLLTLYLGYDKLDAIRALALGSNPECRSFSPLLSASDHSRFTYPSPASKPYSRVTAYLVKSRALSNDTVSALMKAGLLYQEASHMNAVFINHEQDYCEIHGTLSFGKSFHGCRRVSPTGYWSFRVGKASPVQRAYVCEGAIDAISLYELHRYEGGGCSGNLYCSIGGVSNQQAIDKIASCAYEVIMAVDNDAAGAACRSRNSQFSSIVPQGKDWNDDLRNIKEKGSHLGA